MKIAACILVLSMLLCAAGEAMAHKVHVFAFSDGEAIQVEAYFSQSRKVRQGRLTISDAQDGRELLHGVTDEQGLFRFRPDDVFLQSGHDLRILLDAGQGHQDVWHMTAAELTALSAADATSVSSDAIVIAKKETSGQTVAELSPTELEILLGRILDEKLAGIRQALARQETEPDLRDIIGGLGWITGLLGLFTWLRYRVRK